MTVIGNTVQRPIHFSHLAGNGVLNLEGQISFGGMTILFEEASPALRQAVIAAELSRMILAEGEASARLLLNDRADSEIASDASNCWSGQIPVFISEIQAAAEAFRAAFMAKDRLFVGAFPAALIYADRYRQVRGDYARLGMLSYGTLTLSVDKTASRDLRAAITQHAASMQLRAGQQYQISTCGQPITLGHQLSTEQQQAMRVLASTFVAT